MGELNKFGIPSGEGNHAEEIIYNMALLYNVLNGKVSSYLKEFNLSTGKFNILVAIRHHGGIDGISQVDVSKHLIVTPSNMTKLVDKLENDGLVIRSSLDGDRRVNIIKISQKAERLLDTMWDGYKDLLKNLVSDISDKNQEKLSKILTDWFDSAQMIK